MSKITQKKWLVLIIIIILFVAVDGMVNNVSIVNRGIAIGLAVDMENDRFVMTAQFILPKNGGVGSGGNNFSTYSAVGDTIHAAINSIGEKLGSQVSLSHTTTLLINKSIIERGKTQRLEYFLTDAELPDTCYLAVTESDAGSFLNAPVAVGETPSYQLQKIFHPVRAQIGVTPVTLKDFFSRYYSDKTGMYLPIVYTEKGLPSTDQEANGSTEAMIFKADRTYIFNKQSNTATLSVDATHGMSILSQPIADGAVTIAGSDGELTSVSVLESNTSLSYNAETKLVTTKIKMKVMRVSASDGSGHRLNFKMTDEEHEAFKKKISTFITAAFNESKEQNIDIFMAYRGFFRDSGGDWLKKAGDDYLASSSINVVIDIVDR